MLFVRGEYKIRIPREDGSEARTRWSVFSSFRRYEISSMKEMLEKTRYELSIRTNTDAGAHNVKSVHRHNYLNETSAHGRISIYICQKYFYESWFSFDVCNWIPRNGDCQVRCVQTVDWSVWTEKTQTQYVRVCVIGRTRPFLWRCYKRLMKILPRECIRVFPKIYQSLVVAISSRWIAQRTRSECINCDGLIHETLPIGLTNARFQRKTTAKKNKLSNWIDLLTFVRSRSLSASTWFE